MLSPAEAEDIIAKALKLSKADACRVSLNSQYQTNLRFADNQMSTSGITDNATLAVQSVVGRRRATATTNDLSPAGLARVVEQSLALARLAPEDPELLPELPPQQYPAVDAWSPNTAGLSAEDRARAALGALEPARSAGDLTAAGFILVNAGSTAVGNSAGLFAYHRATNANYTLTVRTKDGTGSAWVSADDTDWGRIDFAALGKRAIAKSRASRNPAAIEPGRYTVILEPQAVADLVGLVAGAMQARAADEGRSPFVKAGGGNKIGEQVMDPRVTLLSDPADPQLLDQPFDGEGLPLTARRWVENGVLRELAYSRFWAQKQGRAPTGNPSTLKLLGGISSLEQMVQQSERAVLVTRLWYLRVVDQRTLVYTGLTRDGTFLVENGRIARSIKNFRFNDSPLFLLNNLEALGPAVRVGGGTVVPALKARDFSFTSLSDAV